MKTIHGANLDCKYLGITKASVLMLIYINTDMKQRVNKFWCGERYEFSRGSLYINRICLVVSLFSCNKR